SSGGVRGTGKCSWASSLVVGGEARLSRIVAEGRHGTKVPFLGEADRASIPAPLPAYGHERAIAPRPRPAVVHRSLVQQATYECRPRPSDAGTAPAKARTGTTVNSPQDGRP